MPSMKPWNWQNAVTDWDIIATGWLNTMQAKDSQDSVKEELLAMVEKYGVDELMIITINYDFEVRCRSYELLAQAWAK